MKLRFIIKIKKYNYKEVKIHGKKLVRLEDPYMKVLINFVLIPCCLTMCSIKLTHSGIRIEIEL